MADCTNIERSEYYGALQDVVDGLFADADMGGLDPAIVAMLPASQQPTVRRLDVVLASESADLPEDLREIFSLLPPGTYTRRRLCDQINSAVAGHAWGRVYGTVE